MTELLWLRLRAPFAAFRWLQAGVYRATSPVIPPSAAWGLVLNLAGVETRAAGAGVTTQVRPDAPPLEIAVGTIGRAEISTLYQQLHSYPVGKKAGAALKPKARGAKYQIAPARRELLVGFDCMLGVKGDGAILARVSRGLRGDLDEPRYGLPFAGDNNLLFDRIDVVASPPEARWYTRMHAASGPLRGSCRLTVGIDRADSSGTSIILFAPTEAPRATPPDDAWTWVPQKPPGA